MRSRQEKRIKTEPNDAENDSSGDHSAKWNDFETQASSRRKAFEKQIAENCKGINQMFNLIINQIPMNQQNMTIGELFGPKGEIPSFDTEMDRMISDAIAETTTEAKYVPRKAIVVVTPRACAPSGNSEKGKGKRGWKNHDETTSSSRILRSDTSGRHKRCKADTPHPSSHGLKAGIRRYSMEKPATPAVARPYLRKKAPQSTSSAASVRNLRQGEMCRLFSKGGSPLKSQPTVVIPLNNTGDMLTVSASTNLNSLPYFAVTALKSMMNKLSTWMATVLPIKTERP